MNDYTPTTEEIIEEWIVGTIDESESRAQFERWFASEIEKAERKILKRAEEAAAQALTTWWLTDTLPEDDTDSVMDVRKAIRGVRGND